MATIRFYKSSPSECADEVDYVRAIYWKMQWELPKFNYVIVTYNECPEYWGNQKLRYIKIFDLEQKNEINDGKVRYDGWIIKIDGEDADYRTNYSKTPISIIDPKYNEEHNSIYNFYYFVDKTYRDIWVEVRYFDLTDD
jgi:hypothetical protein